ncbi:caspase family protein [Arenimonas oryziterrae]|uniref:Peptidase C14 caspase domain-containing protein n=1 Tax=Arenimonas oryziterrae DSM 21050 = YC6267 TaxID=1121015 RepID=A0A091B9X8_9GAMM|nr:caspase family protein [Arenimonas oryziterrae]KFN41265.1 hypothetical protein N789_05090 [Arenimonas oryziterrae DSM 21050 = YC6267]
MNASNECPVLSRLYVFCAAALIVIGAGLPVQAPKAAVKNAEDLLIVDCLLPGQIRSLGRQATFLSARRPVRTTQSDCQIRGGEYVSYDRANYQTALKVWLDQAMAGSAEAQNNVGEIYSKGLGTAPDYGMAFQWFKKAADQGYGRAKINLGYLYESGLGVPQDTAAALNLYREASGITDELLYASTVEVQLKAKDEQIGTLQGQVQSEQANSAQLREQVRQLEQQLAERRRALQTSQRELQDTQNKLAQAKQAKDSELTRFLENQMLTQEQQISSQRSQIASLEQRGSSGTGGQILAGTPVTMEILDPTFVATRGRNTAVVRGAGKRTLVGRVSAPKAIARITVNGVAAPVASNGTFSAEINVAPGGTPVQVAAVDTRGAKAQLDFTMIPAAGGAASTAAGSRPATSGVLPRDVKLGRFFAVVIGNNTYRDGGFAPLKSAASDATAVNSVLRDRYGYQTTLLLNAGRLEILTALNEMREKLGPQDNLLIYYAGHGEIDTSKQGYWIPSDAAASNPKTWISNAAISDILNTMPAKHVLVVADSCYSGAMTRASAPSFDAGSMPADKWGTWVKTMANGRSRTALTSGGEQPVPDVGAGNHSYFARAFLNVLQDNNRLLEAQRVFREVSTSLALNAAKSPLPQDPQYAPIRYAGHESGEYFFLPKGATAAGP